MSNDLLPSWTDPKEFPMLISQANKDYNFGLTGRQIDSLKRSIEKFYKLKAERVDSLSPIGVRLVGKGDFATNWERQYAWLQDRMAGIDYSICNCIDKEGIEQKGFCEGPSIELIKFDLRRPQGGVNLGWASSLSLWAGLEFLTQLCLSPQCYPRLNGKDLPIVCAYGVRYAKTYAPIFRCTENGEIHIQARFINNNGPDKSEHHFWAKTQTPTISVIR